MGALVGIVLVLLFMVVYYEVGGVVADVAVLLNLLFLLRAHGAVRGDADAARHRRRSRSPSAWRSTPTC